jgi:predicted aconitase
MELTSEENEILKGSKGPACQLAMEILVEIGEVYQAPRLIPVESAHIVISNYKSSCEAGIEILEKFVSLGAKAAIPTTIDPAGIDLDWSETNKIPKGLIEKQRKIRDAFRALDFIPCWTCIPYLFGQFPRKGDHLAWTESSAVVFANSMVGARTNRETAGMDLAISLTGRTPYHGLHLKEKRWGELLIEIQLQKLTREHLIILGYFTGLQAGTRIPVLKGIEKGARLEDYIGMGAASAASGGVALYHITGITPEAPTLQDAFGKNAIPQPILFGPQQLAETKKKMCTAKPGLLDAVMVGCPHYTLVEIRDLAQLLEGRKINSGVRFWIYTHKSNILLAERLGYKSIIEKAGAEFVADTCMVVTHVEHYGFNRIMTDSGKCAHYAPTEIQAEVIFGSMGECVDSATKGEWGGLP